MTQIYADNSQGYAPALRASGEPLRPASTQRILKSALICVICGLLFSSCSSRVDDDRSTLSTEGTKRAVHVVNYPLQYFAQRIGGDAVEAVFPEMDGDPVYWEPTPKEVTAFQDADLILLNGAGYARWVATVSLPPSKRVNTSVVFEDRYIKLQDAVTHTHGPGGEHAHGNVAFTTWLDPQLAIEQARSMTEAFSRMWPEHKNRFKDGFSGLEENLRALDKELSEVTSGQGSIPLVMSHPVYQYFERRYGLNAKSVHWEPDALPDARMVKELEEMLVNHPAKRMIWEGEPMAEAVQLLRDLGVESVVFDPCGNAPTHGDYLSVMRRNVENLRDALGP